MKSKTSLLIEIAHPESAETLRLMCGNGFEVLRTDKTGREIYGTAHNGQEFLLFPMDFRAEKAGVLLVNVPFEYREWLFDKQIDGARIVFSAPHGTPCFAGMPEEFHSNSGFLRLDEQERLLVMLDRHDPLLRHTPKEHDPHGSDCGHDGCGCGHGRADARADLPPPLPPGTDHEIAAEIREKADRMNTLLRQAASMGLLVEIDIEHPHDVLGAKEGCVQISVTGILKPL